MILRLVGHKTTRPFALLQSAIHCNKQADYSVQRKQCLIAGLVNSVLNLPDGQVKYFEESNLQKNCEINSAHQKLLGTS